MTAVGPKSGVGPEPIDTPLLQALRDRAESLEIGANRPIALDTAQAVWFVERGAVEIFATHRSEDPRRGATRTHIQTVPAGEMIFGLERRRRRLPFGRPTDDDTTPTQLIAVGTPGTRLLHLELLELKDLARHEETVPALVERIERWVTGLYGKIPRAAAPRKFVPLVAGQEHSLDAETHARTRSGVLWIRHVDGQSRFLGYEELPMETDGPPLPLSDETWLTTGTGARLSAVETPLLLKSGGVWEGLSTFHQLFLRYVDLWVERSSEGERLRLERKAELDRRALDSAYDRLASVLGQAPRATSGTLEEGSQLLAACRLVGRADGIEIQAPPPTLGGVSRHPIGRICAASRIRFREVLLRDAWWTQDNGPLLAYVETESPEGGRPRRRAVALLPTSPRSYELVDPSDNSRQTVDEALAETLGGIAVMFYRPFPERAINGWDLVRAAAHGQRQDLLTIVAMGIIGGLLATSTPIITGYLFGRLIPNADRSQVYQMTLALIVVALATGIFQITRSIGVLRIGGKMDGSVQAAVWDRLLSLPASFFRQYRVGDLAKRSMGIDAIRDLVTGHVTTSLLSAVFSVFSFALLFVYSWRLALVASAFVLWMLAITLVLSVLQIRHQRRYLEEEGEIASLLFGLINGIAKLRISGAEHRAFARWAERFAAQRRVAIKVRQTANLQNTFNAVYGLASTLGIFAMVGFSTTLEIGVDDFLAFHAAFGQFQAATLSIIGLLPSILTIVPLYERLRPILETPPEVDDSKVEVADLSGGIELSHVSFRYREDGPLILDDVSFQAEPGEFIALVGPSGSGKSTCLRLILAFDRPDAGSIYFDGQDLQSLDILSLRRQIGVVMQNGRPMSGTIYSNIVGSSNLGLEAAWTAARMAGLEADIQAMPMGMHTVISEGAGTFSGGQIQRLMIARAIVNRPRIVLFDEATSALDNQTQDIVRRSLEELKATRIVVAHRLSTIRAADRIVVIQGGRVVEQGTYDELMALDGPFTQLARRQIA